MHCYQSMNVHNVQSQTKWNIVFVYAILPRSLFAIGNDEVAFSLSNGLIVNVNT